MTGKSEEPATILAVGQTGEPGPTGESSREEITVLVAGITDLTGHMADLASAMRDLANRFQGNADVTIERVETAVKLNKLSTIIGSLLVPLNIALVVVVFLILGQSNTQQQTLNGVQNEVSAIHNTQTTNSGLTKTDNEILKQVLSVTNPQSETANNQRILQLFTHLELCLENHGDRAREQIAHLPLKPLVKGCAADGT